MTDTGGVGVCSVLDTPSEYEYVFCFRHGEDGAAQRGENDLRRWWGFVEYITSLYG